MSNVFVLLDEATTFPGKASYMGNMPDVTIKDEKMEVNFYQVQNNFFYDLNFINSIMV